MQLIIDQDIVRPAPRRCVQGELPGLQILLHGEWIDVPPRRGAFICNVGDMLQRW